MMRRTCVTMAMVGATALVCAGCSQPGEKVASPAAGTPAPPTTPAAGPPPAPSEVGDTPAPPTRKIAYSPYPEQTSPNRVYFGDTHLHTSYSWDAGMIGNTLGPDEAYRFARGETVTSSTRLKTRLSRPLDFLVVADHAEGLGVSPMLATQDPIVMKDPLGSQLAGFVKNKEADKAYDGWRRATREGKNTLITNQTMIHTAWKRLTAAAEKYNEPGRFTAIIGYESSNLSPVSSRSISAHPLEPVVSQVFFTIR